MLPDRFVIIGKSGTGKTTLATQLAERLLIDDVELDAIHWLPNWTQLPKPLMREKVNQATPPDGRWVVDGNYKVVRDIVWPRAEVLVWLDYSLMFTLWRLICRTVGRIIMQKELWNGNREHIANHLKFDTQENLFLYTIKCHWEHRKEMPSLLKQPEYSHLKVLRFQNPRETDEWLRTLAA